MIKQQKSLDFNKMNGLLPVVVQNVENKEVLMVGFMNEAAWKKTKNSGKVTFWSRTRGALWTKGETSGNYLQVQKVFLDCDNDTLLIQVNPKGPVCHLGTNTCFEKELK